jgi:cardiolipin synthase (CMP-forming)
VVERTEWRVLTLPNLLSVLRLLGVPLFLWLLLAGGGTPTTDVWAIIVLALGGISDWADGKLARLLDQYSRLGELLDPAVDRLYILAALLGLGLRGVVPWWAVGVLVGRDLVLAACLPLLRRRGYGPPPVVYLGKAATFLLLWTFPLLLGGLQTGWFADLCRPTGYAFAVWGSALYLYTGVLYLAQIVRALRAPRAQPVEPPY